MASLLGSGGLGKAGVRARSIKACCPAILGRNVTRRGRYHSRPYGDCLRKVCWLERRDIMGLSWLGNGADKGGGERAA